MHNDLIILAERVVDGTGEEMPMGAGLAISEGKISGLIDADSDSDYTYPGCTIMPGFINVHDHLFTGLAPSIEEQILHAARRAALTLSQGVTMTRDMGSPRGNVPELRTAIERGIFPGPRIKTCIKALTAPGGPGSGLSMEVKGVESASSAARELADQGADFLKIFASSDGTNHGPLLSENEMIAIAKVAKERDLRFVAHATTREAIAACIRVGMDGIEHGPALDSTLAEEMASADIYFAPTMSGFETLARRGPEWGRPDSVIEHFSEHVVDHPRAIRAAMDAKVKFVTGGDSLGSVPEEARLLHDAGLGLPEIVRAATLNAAEYLDVEDVGLLREGYRADLVVLEGHPLQDITAFERPVAVIAGGLLWDVKTIRQVFAGDFLSAMQG